jgi:LysM repeat protein
MNQFELPSNIKQIGSIGDNPRIYVEDYVCTYLKQYAESGEHCEKIAFLIGKYLVIDSQPVLFVNGAVQGKYTEFENGIENFTQQSFTYAEQQLEKYFKDFEIIGWMQSQPGYSVFLNPGYAKYHMTHFRKPYHMLFVIDPIEKMNAFYVWNAEMTNLTEAKGYFVYYDKNPGMQAYMLDNKFVGLDLKEKEANIEKIREGGSRYERELSGVSDHDQPRLHARKYAAPRRTEAFSDSKRLVNMLMSLSAVLFIICFIMGAGLIQNDDRLTQLEANINTLNDTYNYVVGQIRQSAQPVFALQNDEEASQAQAQGEAKPEDAAAQTENAAAPPSPVAEDTAANNADGSDNAVADNGGTAASESAESAAAVINIAPESNIPDTYVVQQGDSLNHISEMFYGTTDMADTIMEVNGLSDPDMIFFGKILILPKE